MEEVVLTVEGLWTGGSRRPEVGECLHVGGAGSPTLRIGYVVDVARLLENH